MKILRKFYKTCLVLAVVSGTAAALPEGATVVNGTVNINTSGNTQTITQGSNRAIINWNGFNIDVGELVHFVQPSSISAILNRVVGQDPSQILGSLRANGQVFLINPNGVIFGQTANVDVGSLVVSTLSITDDDFLAGNLNFAQEADKDLAAVINHGTIKIDENGFLVFTGPMLANDGIILAKVGQVAMAAGTQSTISFDPTGMIQIALPDAAQTQSGIVSLSQELAGNILSNVVGTSITQAGQIVERDDRTFLEVECGTVVQAGDVVVDGRAGVDAGAVIIDSSANTILSSNSTISASGDGLNSNGGTVLVLSDGAAVSETGSIIEARGGETGDGGFVEQSSDSGRVAVWVDTRAPGGEAGEFLIDPERVIVETGAGGSMSGGGIVYISENTLESLPGGLQTLQTEDGIFFESFVGGTLDLPLNTTLRIALLGPGDGGLAVDFQTPGDTIAATSSMGGALGAFQLINSATGDINNLNVSATESGQIFIQQNSTGAFTGTTNLTTNNGDITINSTAGGDFLGTMNLTTLGTGDILVNGTGDFLGTTNLTPGDLFSLQGNNIPLLQLNVASQMTGTSMADINVDATGRNIILNGVNFTGATLDLTAADIRQINQANLNQGTFDLTVANDVGTSVAPLRLDGTLSASVTGDLFVESTGTLTLSGISANNATGTGLSYIIEGSQNATNLFSLTSSTLLGGTGPGADDINADIMTLSAPDIGILGGNFIEVNPVTTINIIANNAHTDDRTGTATYNITNTQDPLLGSTFFLMEDSGEGVIFSDDGSVIDSEDILPLNVSLIGDRSFTDLGGDENVSVTTVADGLGSADLTGTLDLDTFIPGTVTLQGENITITELLLGAMGGTMTFTATGGDVNIDSNIIAPLNLSGSATGLFLADHTGALTVGDVTAGTIDLTATATLNSVGNTRLIADQVNLDGAQVTVSTRTAGLDVNSGGSITISQNGRDITSGTLVAGATDRIELSGTGINISGVTTTSQDVTLSTTAPGNIDATINTTGQALVSANDITLNLNGPRLQAFADGNIDVTANTPNLNLTTLAVGDVSVVNTGGGLAVSRVSGDNVVLDTQNNRGIILSPLGGPQTITGTDSVTLLARDITANIVTPNVTAVTNGGPISLSGSNPNLEVTADAMGGDVSVLNTGNISTNQINGGTVTLDTRDTGVPQGDISRTSGNITANDLILEGVNITANTEVNTITANAPGNIIINNTSGNISQADLVAGGSLSFSTSGTATLNTFQGTDLTLSVAQAVTGALVGNTVNVTGTTVNLDVTANSVNATATAGDVTLTGNNTDITVSANAGSGSVDISNNGNIATGAIQGADVSITAANGSGNITNSSGRITGTNSVNLTGNDITASTSTPSLTALNANTVSVDNDSSNLTPTIGASGTVQLSSTGAISGGQLSGSSLQVSAQSISSGINTGSVQTTSSNGDTTLSSSSSTDLTVVNSVATNGDYNLTHSGNVNFDRIEANNVNIDAGPTGNITDTSNTIIATGITLNGNNILVNTQGQILVVTAQRDVTITNTTVDVSSLSVDAQGNVSFGTDGDVSITQVAGGPLVSLTAGGNINANTGATVSGTDVVLEVGGQITPDLNNPLDVQATNSIEVVAPFGGPVLAQGGVIAAALEGIIPASAVVVSSSSGPVFYNGVLLNPTSTPPSPTTPPPVTPPPVADAVNQIGQQNGQVVDDGSQGSAANDGIVEPTPTQELVAQLTEAANANGGLPTEMLITLKVDELGEVQVSLQEPSPFDEPIENSEEMTADDILDLGTGELTDVKVTIYYDAASDQLVLAVDLRADDIMDLDVGDYQELPVNLDYSFLSDARLTLDKLRADDLIDLEVEDLGQIPIRVEVYE